jgi:hypothetical protein
MFPKGALGTIRKIFGKIPVQAAADSKRIAAAMIAPLAHFSQGAGICPCLISGNADFKFEEIVVVNMEILLLDSSEESGKANPSRNANPMQKGLAY